MSGNMDIADKIAIAELFARYSQFVDSNQAEAWVALFEPDAVFEIVGVTRLEGAAQLIGMPAMLDENGKGKWRHQITDIVSEWTPDGATASAYGLVTDWSEGGKFVTFGNYAATLRRAGGNWRFATLTARMAGG